jgi:hypothetical protein
MDGRILNNSLFDNFLLCFITHNLYYDYRLIVENQLIGYTKQFLWYWWYSWRTINKYTNVLFFNTWRQWPTLVDFIWISFRLFFKFVFSFFCFCLFCDLVCIVVCTDRTSKLAVLNPYVWLLCSSKSFLIIFSRIGR